MPAPGIEFVTRRSTAPAGPSTRADVAVFAGLIGRQPGALPAALRSALAEAGWRDGGTFDTPDGRIECLLGVPIAVQSWAEFDALFNWRSRAPVAGSALRMPCPLGLAVRQFFAQGGAKAWIVRCGDPLSLAAPDLTSDQFAERQLRALAGPIAPDADGVPILPGFQSRSRDADPLDPATWAGAAAIYAIDDAAMLLLPDLPDLAAGPPQIAEPLPEPPGPPEAFRPCAPVETGEPALPERKAVPDYRAVRLGQARYRVWSAALTHALALLGRPRGPAHRRDVMMVSALPLPDPGVDLGGRIAQWPLDLLAAAGFAGSTKAPLALFDAAAIGNARLQLGYPWLATPDAAACPEGLQSPEGTLAGMLSRSALELGGFRSAAGRAVRGSMAAVPDIAPSDRSRGLPGRADWLGDRLCLFAVQRGVLELASDATMADSRAWRKGGVSRLVGIILRACRDLGAELLFEPNGPHLWSRLAGSVTAVLEALRASNAFEGAAADTCYQVICDQRSMSPADIDQGRLRCDVVINPASPIDRIVVTLALLDPVPAHLRAAA